MIQAPLLLPLFALLPDAKSSPLPTAIFYFLVDLLNAYALVTISESGQSVKSRLHAAARQHVRWDGVSVAAWYVQPQYFAIDNKILTWTGSCLIHSRLRHV
jgi:phosphatidylinositol glycan class U